MKGDRVYIPKLFGGPAHGRRQAIPSASWALNIAITPKLPVISYNDPNQPPAPIGYTVAQYMRHSFAICERRFEAFVYEKANSDKREQMVLNWLFRKRRPPVIEFEDDPNIFNYIPKRIDFGARSFMVLSSIRDWNYDALRKRTADWLLKDALPC